MANDANNQNLPAVPAKLQLKAEPPTMFDGKVHVGVAIGLSTEDKPSALVVPDVTGVGKGTSPVYLAKPLKIHLEKILDYIEKKGPGTKKAIEDNQQLKGFLTNTSVAIDSFYYRGAQPEQKGDGILLMQFALNFTKEKKDEADKEAGEGKGGLIGSLTGDPDLSQMFDITGLSLRVLRCDKDNVEVLQNYVDGLSEE